MSSRRTEFFSGVRAELPILFGVIPFGLIYGVLARSAGIPLEIAVGMSSIVFAGSAQVVGTQLIATGTPGIVILLTIAVINLRHMLYSASVAPYLKPLPARWKYILAYLLTDEAYAVSIAHYLETDTYSHVSPFRHWYFLGAGLALWSTWQLSTILGIFAGAQIPANWSLDFTLALTFIALVVPALKDRPAVAAAVSAGIVAVLAGGLPYRLGLMVAAFTGIAVGLWVERRTATETHQAAAISKTLEEL